MNDTKKNKHEPRRIVAIWLKYSWCCDTRSSLCHCVFMILANWRFFVYVKKLRAFRLIWHSDFDLYKQTDVPIFIINSIKLGRNGSFDQFYWQIKVFFSPNKSPQIQSSQFSRRNGILYLNDFAQSGKSTKKMN